ARERPNLVGGGAVSGEATGCDQACDAVATELDQTIERVRAEVGEDSADIFRGHRAILRDPAFVAKVKGYILNDQLDATSSLNKTLEEYDLLFARIRDDYLRERMTDIRDVAEQITNPLGVEPDRRTLGASEPLVLVAPEIRPSQAAMFDKLPVTGIATEAGGSTGHAAVLARGLGIPAVSGLSGLLGQVHNGDLLIVDGREGIVIVNPGPEVEAAYRKLQREYVDLRDSLIENKDLESVTRDGERVELLCNVNTVIDAAAAAGVGASGVGLFRTEYVFITHPTVPTEDEQVEAYRKIIDAAPNRSVVIRTLDLGGDKQVKYFSNYRQANPFMGWRSIR